MTRFQPAPASLSLRMRRGAEREEEPRRDLRRRAHRSQQGVVSKPTRGKADVIPKGWLLLLHSPEGWEEIYSPSHPPLGQAGRSSRTIVVGARPGKLHVMSSWSRLILIVSLGTSFRYFRCRGPGNRRVFLSGRSDPPLSMPLMIERHPHTGPEHRRPRVSSNCRSPIRSTVVGTCFDMMDGIPDTPRDAHQRVRLSFAGAQGFMLIMVEDGSPGQKVEIQNHVKAAAAVAATTTMDGAPGGALARASCHRRLAKCSAPGLALTPT